MAEPSASGARGRRLGVLVPVALLLVAMASMQAHFTQGVPRWKSKWGLDVFGQWRETYYRFNEIDTDKLKTYAVLYGEYHPRPDLTLRLEVDNVGARAFRHVRVIYDDLRNSSPLAYTDIRDLHGGRAYYLRVRKSFG